MVGQQLLELSIQVRILVSQFVHQLTISHKKLAKFCRIDIMCGNALLLIAN